MERPVVIVHGLPADTKAGDIRDLFQKSLQKDGLTDEFRVIYPVLNCKGIESADANKRVALLVFWDQLPANCLCNETFENLTLEPMKDQIVLRVSNRGDQFFWVEFGDSDVNSREDMRSSVSRTVQTEPIQTCDKVCDPQKQNSAAENGSLETLGPKLEKLPSPQSPVVTELGDRRGSAARRHEKLDPIRPESKASPRRPSTSNRGNPSRATTSRPHTADIEGSVMPEWSTTPKDFVGEHPYCCKAVASDHVVFIYKGDITKVSVDVVVTPAGASLMAHTPVAAAIAKAAGKATKRECQNIVAEERFIAQCGAVVTTGGRLCKKIVHAVMPISLSSQEDVEDGFGKTLRNSLDAAEKLNLPSIAIPTMSPDNLPSSTIGQILQKTLEKFCTSIENLGSLREIHLVESETKQAFENKHAFESSSLFVSIGTPWAAMEPRSPVKCELPKSPDEKESDTCAICRDPPQEPTRTLPCQHRFCQECIERSFDVKPVCPECGAIYGPITGDQPKDGKMTHTVDNQLSLIGYPNCGTIVIEYYFPSGIQMAEHPNPGVPYRGTTRTAYLPDNTEGREVLQLLEKAFDARLTFTVGQSVTTGQSNQLTWNDIHHNTSCHGGDQYGYPDLNYLQRVKGELAAKGIKL